MPRTISRLALCHHEAGHAIAMLAIDERSPVRGPWINRVLVRQRAEWATPYTDWRGRGMGEIMGIVERDPRVWSYELRRGAGGVVEDPAVRAALAAGMVEDMAGPAAEVRWQGQSRYAHLFCDPTGWNIGDVEAAKERASYLGGDGSSLLHKAWHDAVDLVNEHWRAVGALARQLCERGAVDGDEVAAIAAAAMPRAFPALRAWPNIPNP